MNTKRFLCYAATMLLSAGALAQNNGGIDSQMLKELSDSYKPTTAEKALQNILLSQPIKELALNQENLNELDTYFSHSMPSKGITNQKSSGRCWLFTGKPIVNSSR